jgi:anti-sigma B factor antagonist
VKLKSFDFFSHCVIAKSVPSAAVDVPAGGREPPPRRSPLFAMSTSTERRGRVEILAVTGEVDVHTAPAVGTAISLALGRRPRRLVVDLSLVRFLDCAGLEVLLAGHREAGRYTDLRLVANTRATWRPLQITRLHETLVIHTSRSAAVTAPSKEGNAVRSYPDATIERWEADGGRVYEHTARH